MVHSHLARRLAHVDPIEREGAREPGIAETSAISASVGSGARGGMRSLTQLVRTASRP
jgi:hypothetical protein